MQVTVDNLTVGGVIYFCHAFADGKCMPYINRLKVVNFPITMKTGQTDFMRVQRGETWQVEQSTNSWVQTTKWDSTEDETSMLDMGIIPNTYNQHRTFTSLREAQQWAHRIHNKTFGKMADDSDDPIDNYDRAMAVLDL